MAGNNGTNFTLTVGLMANPVVANFNWTLNGKKLSDSGNVKVMAGELHFTPLLVDSKGNYSVRDCNNVSCSSLIFDFAVYCKFQVWLQGVLLGLF